MLAILGESATGSHAAAAADDSDILALPRRIVTAVLGEQPMRDIFRTARAELYERARLLLDEELRRFSEVIDGAGTCDEVAGVRLYQAAFDARGASVTSSTPPFAWPNTHLPARLKALSSLVQIARDRSGPGGFSPELLAEAEALLERADERLNLSPAHTVVTLAGGTGSGKSSLFNALAGATFRRPP